MFLEKTVERLEEAQKEIERLIAQLKGGQTVNAATAAMIGAAVGSIKRDVAWIGSALEPQAELPKPSPETNRS